MVSCLFAQAITLEELRQWVERVIEQEERVPGYLIDLLDFQPPLHAIFKTIGFVPHWPFSRDEELALYNFAFLRGRRPYDCPLTPEQAARKLKAYSHIEQTFRAEFPFLEPGEP